MGRESKSERCDECEGRTKQRDILSAKGEQNRELCRVRMEKKLRDVVSGKVEQNREMC